MVVEWGWKQLELEALWGEPDEEEEAGVWWREAVVVWREEEVEVGVAAAQALAEAGSEVGMEVGAEVEVEAEAGVAVVAGYEGFEW